MNGNIWEYIFGTLVVLFILLLITALGVLVPAMTEQMLQMFRQVMP